MADATAVFPFFSIPIYSLALVTGIVLSIGIGLRRAALRPSTVLDAGLGACLGGVIGARIGHVLLNWAYFADNLERSAAPERGRPGLARRADRRADGAGAGRVVATSEAARSARCPIACAAAAGLRGLAGLLGGGLRAMARRSIRWRIIRRGRRQRRATCTGSSRRATTRSFSGWRWRWRC